MPVRIPLLTSVAWQRTTVPLNLDDGTSNPANTGAIQEFLFQVKWNARDSSFYLDLYDANGNAIANGMRMVLGCYLGRRVHHPIFRTGAFAMLDTSGKGVECGYDDLNRRVILVRFTVADIMGGTGNIPAQPGG